MQPLELWERESKISINRARSSVRRQMARSRVELPPTEGTEYYIAELEAIEDILEEAAAHIDTHRQIRWEFDPPLPR